ncbi:MAG: SGNH/GDSL hydrolase family protein [Pseudonocardiaceae bacterium]|nr:SGNH/GDSL hydrolase family protein [Pseudonocardiaceae bacterium]
MRATVRAAAILAGTIGGLSGAALGTLSRQTRSARRVLAVPGWVPLRADGVYTPDGSGPVPRAALPASADIVTLAVLGDSTAAGLGVDRPEDLPGVVLARNLADEAGRPVQLDTYAISGSSSRRLADQVRAALLSPPEAALIMVGANDIRDWVPPATAATLLGTAVSALRSAGAAVVTGTCPDLGVVRPIPQPTRAFVRNWSITLARLQREAVRQAGGHPVPLADLLAPEFLSRPEALMSRRDGLHPSAAGYEAACSVLLPALCSALGVWGGGAVAPAPTRSASVDARRWSNRVAASADRGLRRVTERLGGVAS